MDVAAVRAEVGPHTVERVLDPPLDAVRMYTVHQQQAGNQVVGNERVREFGLRLDSHAHHALQACAVEVGYFTDQLLRAFVRDGAT